MKKVLIVFFAFCFVALGAAVAYSIAVYQAQIVENQEEEKEDGFLETSGEFKDKLADIKIRRDRAEVQIDRLTRRKNEAAEKLRAKGIQKSSDIKADDREAKFLVAELKDLVEKIEKLESDVKHYDDAIVSIEAILRDFDRKLVMTDSGIDEKQLEDLRRIIYSVDDKLTGDMSISEELDTADMIDEILGNHSSEDNHSEDNNTK